MANRVIFFDVVETLFSLEPLEHSFTAMDLPEDTAQLFFAQLLRDAFALSAAGDFYSFPEIAKGTLTVLLKTQGVDPDPSILQNILGAFSVLPAYQDVKPALQRLHHAECRAVLLTNGTRGNTEKLLQNNGLTAWVDDVLSVDDLGVWKPQSQLYLKAASRHQCEPGNAVLVAAHAWDIHGAMAAGLKGVWVRRQDTDYHPLMGRPDGIAYTLVDAVNQALEVLETPPPA